MSALQTEVTVAARAVLEVSGTVVAAKQSNAQAKARELSNIFVNFVFIVIVSFCLKFFVLALRDLSLIENSSRAVH